MALTDNLVSWYDLESDGTDALGTNTLSTNTNNSFGSGSGKVGNGVSVNAKDANHSVLALTSGATGLNIGTGNLSISCWINRQGAGVANSTWPPIVALGTGTDFINVTIHPTDGRILLMQLSDGANYHYAYFSAGITGTGWHHLVAIRDSATAGMRLYVDGTELSESSSADGGSTTTLNLEKIYLGGTSYDANDEFCGYIDLVGIWTRALDSTDIATLYNGGAGYTPYYTPSSPVILPTRHRSSHSHANPRRH
jgi:hypothetical protein